MAIAGSTPGNVQACTGQLVKTVIADYYLTVKPNEMTNDGQLEKQIA